MSNYYTHKQIFYINSDLKLTGTDSDFTYSIPIDPQSDFDRVALLDCSIPKSYYLIHSLNNTFTVELWDGVTVMDTRVITLPVGNYNRSSFAKSLTTLLGTGYNITFQNINKTVDNGRYTFTYSGTYKPVLILTNNLHEQIGVMANSTNHFTGTANNWTFESIHICNFRTEGTLFLHSNICQDEGNQILQNIITTNNANYDFIVYRSNTVVEYAKHLSRGSSNIYSFKLTDENGVIIDLNGINLVFTIMIYKKNDIDKLINGFIKLMTLKN